MNMLYFAPGTTKRQMLRAFAEAAKRDKLSDEELEAAIAACKKFSELKAEDCVAVALSPAGKEYFEIPSRTTGIHWCPEHTVKRLRQKKKGEGSAVSGLRDIGFNMWASPTANLAVLEKEKRRRQRLVKHEQ